MSTKAPEQQIKVDTTQTQNRSSQKLLLSHFYEYNSNLILFVCGNKRKSFTFIYCHLPLIKIHRYSHGKKRLRIIKIQDNNRKL